MTSFLGKGLLMWLYLASINNKIEAAVLISLLLVFLALSMVIMRKIWRARSLKFWGIEVQAPLVVKKTSKKGK